jgi:hypothetical protein
MEDAIEAYRTSARDAPARQAVETIARRLVEGRQQPPAPGEEDAVLTEHELFEEVLWWCVGEGVRRREGMLYREVCSNGRRELLGLYEPVRDPASLVAAACHRETFPRRYRSASRLEGSIVSTFDRLGQALATVETTLLLPIRADAPTLTVFRGSASGSGAGVSDTVSGAFLAPRDPGLPLGAVAGLVVDAPFMAPPPLMLPDWVPTE